MPWSVSTCVLTGSLVSVKQVCEHAQAEASWGGAGQAWGPTGRTAPHFPPSPEAAIRGPVAKAKSARSAPGATSSPQNVVFPAGSGLLWAPSYLESSSHARESVTAHLAGSHRP